MSGLAVDLASDFADYGPMLSRQCREGGEAGLHDAYLIGRRALNGGYSVLDIVQAHHDGLLSLGASTPAEGARRIERAAAFLGECLAPFEMAVRGLHASNASLMTLNTELEAANSRLKAETAGRERIEETLRQAQKFQAVGRLAGGVAHHFNNLLTVILGNLDIVQRRDLDPAARHKRLAAATEAAMRGARVTRQLLTFSGRQHLKPDLFEPDARLPDLAALIAGSLGTEVSVEFAFPPGLWPVKLDASELELALLNLCINARDAMPAGGRLRVSAANRAIRDERLGIDGDYLAIEVADNGEGIAPDVLSKVFDPFFTTKDVGVGTGLGLSQVHGFVHQSGGAVDIESEVGRGTTVRLYLPALTDAETGTGTDEPALRGAMGTILVVEDDVDVAEVAVEILASCGFEVRLSYRAQGALDLLQRGEKVDLVFSDIAMPDGMSGIELAAEVKRRHPDLPVLLATGYSDALSDAEVLGFQIIAKPYRSNDLCNRIDALLGTAR
ncbi:ATP-binding protein [Phenylobacterium sp.]|uniref:ATP-binding protein n=1 Tax=Phenylobacterium sp. TaxID=1871053 RepID=UPI002736E663|nr:ATP-binding protein [Phenylobacterium sp.]MDP3854071.1 ATP-binding protein [Phenylobacterium sp.]